MPARHGPVAARAGAVRREEEEEGGDSGGWPPWQRPGSGVGVGVGNALLRLKRERVRALPIHSFHSFVWCWLHRVYKK